MVFFFCAAHLHSPPLSSVLCLLFLGWPVCSHLWLATHHRPDLITLACVDTYGFYSPTEVTETGMCGSRPKELLCLICCYTGFTGVGHNLLSFSCHRLSLRWLCAHALCFHPKQSTMSSVNGPISFMFYAVKEKQTLSSCALLTLFWSLTPVHLPRPGLAGVWTGEDGLYTEQQAQGDPPGDAVGCCTWWPPAGGGWLSGLPRGQLKDISSLSLHCT